MTLAPPAAPPAAGPAVAPAGPVVPGTAPPAPARMGARRGRVTTPRVLRGAMAAAWLPIAAFAVAVHVGVTRDHDAVDTVGREATQGITVAQQIKANLSALDGIVVQDLLDPVPLATSGFPEEYDSARRSLDENLVLAAAQAPPGAAYSQPLVNIDYALAHYHALLRESFAARAQGDAGRATEIYRSAHAVMDGTLLPQADLFDKANSYVLNATYDRHTARSSSTVQFIVGTWVVLLVLLAVAQLLLARKFRRVLNLALLVATAIGIATGAYALAALDQSSTSLTAARERAFDPVHQLARARATVVSARQAEGHWLLDPSGGAPAEADFLAKVDKLFRVHDGGGTAAERAAAGLVPPGAGGYLATVVAADVSESGDAAARDALAAFGGYLEDHARMQARVTAGDFAGASAAYLDGEAFTRFVDAIDHAQSADQRTFDRHVDAATGATAHLAAVNLAAAAAMAALVVFGLYLRLREYQG
ncbi:MAG TPA: hypothetical protein VFI47_07900 [Acidimicrobiales bacterium]|nr:hypothetical protein [Acidimicrobiales bacterium]